MYSSVKTIFIDHQKFSVKNYYAVQLKGRDGTVHEVIVYVRSIRYPQDPEEASNVAVLQLSQYIKWNLIHPDAPDNGLLLMFSDAVCMGTILDSETFSATAVIKVRECVQVAHTLDIGAPGYRSPRACSPALDEAKRPTPNRFLNFWRFILWSRRHILRFQGSRFYPPIWCRGKLCRRSRFSGMYMMEILIHLLSADRSLE